MKAQKGKVIGSDSFLITALYILCHIWKFPLLPSRRQLVLFMVVIWQSTANFQF